MKHDLKLRNNVRSSAQQSFLNSSAVPNRQSGMSMLAVISLIGIIAFVSLFAFKVVPGYLEFATVKSIGNDIATNPELLKKPKSKVLQAINQAYRTNSLYDLKPEETFVLTRDGEKGYLVQIDYERRSNLFKNIYVVTSFNHSF